MGTWRDWLMEQLVNLPPDDDNQDDHDLGAKLVPPSNRSPGGPSWSRNRRRTAVDA